jgi:hypothetical protein
MDIFDIFAAASFEYAVYLNLAATDPPSTTSLDGSTTSYGVEGKSSSSPTDVHTHGGTSKILHEDVPTPVETYKTHLTPWLWPG